MENCPIEILENILFRLPFAAALQATKVCKTWKNLLANRCYGEEGFLVSYYLSGNTDVQLYYGEQYDHIHGDDVSHRNKMMNYFYGRFDRKFGLRDVVVGSCNGLICLRQRDQRSGIQYIICNPLTEEYVFVPHFDYTSLEDKGAKLAHRESWSRHNIESASDGFGYCQSTNEYKVIRIYYSKADVGNILVYTIGSHEWRNIGIIQRCLSSSRGIFVNGILHWLTLDANAINIFGFDLKDEKFQLLPTVPCDLFGLVSKRLKLLGGNLCFVLTTSYTIECIQIWAFKRNNKNQLEEHDQTCGYYDNSSWNWIKEFGIKPSFATYLEPFAVTRRNQVLLWYLTTNALYGYDPDGSTLSKLLDSIMGNAMKCSCIECIPHTNSFVSLKDLGESGVKSCKDGTIARRHTEQAKRKR